MHGPFRDVAHAIGSTLPGDSTLRAAKNLRNALVDRCFRRRGRADGHRLAGELAARGVRDVVFTIAFNSPWVIDLLTLAWADHLADVMLVVVDNSSDPTSRRSHADLCRRRGLPYVGLPPNPEWSPNRSHGIALNWVWFNVVRNSPLDVVGFIDHDLIPIAAFDVRARMRDRDAYGMRGASLTHAEAWNLWAGYCFLRPAAAVGRTVDFKHRIEYGLDTGGGNWQGLYRGLAAERIGEAAYRRVNLPIPEAAPPGGFLLLDEAFLHFEGVSYRREFRDPATRGRLARAVLGRAVGNRQAKAA